MSSFASLSDKQEDKQTKEEQGDQIKTKTKIPPRLRLVHLLNEHFLHKELKCTTPPQKHSWTQRD